MPVASLLASSLLGAVTKTMEYMEGAEADAEADADAEDMRDLDTENTDDNTDNLDSMDGRVRPRMNANATKRWNAVSIRCW